MGKIVGYNIHLKIVPKSELQKARSCKTYKEILDTYDNSDNEYVGVYDFFDGYSDFCFGSDESWMMDIQERYGSDILTTEDIRGYFEGDLFEISIEGFAGIIEFYREDVCRHYKEKVEKVEYLLKNPDKSETREYSESLESIMSMLFFKTQDWGGGELKTQPYNKHKTNETILNSNSYEYMVFELVRLYKKINLEKESIVIYGY